jgi:hypothetical protein
VGLGIFRREAVLLIIVVGILRCVEGGWAEGGHLWV